MACYNIAVTITHMVLPLETRGVKEWRELNLPAALKAAPERLLPGVVPRGELLE